MVIRVRVAWVHPQIRRLLHTPRGAVLGYWYTSAYMAGRAALREGAICALQEAVRIVDRPQEIENDAALTFFGGSGGDADESQG